MIVESGSRCWYWTIVFALPELGRQLVVVGELGEELADRVVDLLGVLEVRHAHLRFVGGQSYRRRAAAYGSARMTRDAAAAEDRREVRRDGAGARRPRDLGLAGVPPGKFGRTWFGFVGFSSDENGNWPLSSCGGLDGVGHLLAAEGVVAVVAREDLGLGSRVRAADRERLQVPVAAVGGQAVRVDRQRLSAVKIVICRERWSGAFCPAWVGRKSAVDEEGFERKSPTTGA